MAAPVDELEGLSILLDECPALALVDLGAAVGAQLDPGRAKLVIVI